MKANDIEFNQGKTHDNVNVDCICKICYIFKNKDVYIYIHNLHLWTCWVTRSSLVVEPSSTCIWPNKNKAFNQQKTRNHRYLSVWKWQLTHETMVMTRIIRVSKLPTSDPWFETCTHTHTHIYIHIHTRFRMFIYKYIDGYLILLVCSQNMFFSGFQNGNDQWHDLYTGTIAGNVPSAGTLRFHDRTWRTCNSCYNRKNELKFMGQGLTKRHSAWIFGHGWYEPTATDALTSIGSWTPGCHQATRFHEPVEGLT